MAEHIPAEVFSPGEYIRDELEARGWTQADLAFILGRPLASINKILSGHKAITPQTALGLAEAFGTSAELWLNLEAKYRLRKIGHGGSNPGFGLEAREVARRARLYELGPVKEMTKRGWIEVTKSPATLEQELLRFFGVTAFGEAPSLCFAARIADYAEWTPSQQAWVCRAKNLARAVKAASFTPKALEQALLELRQLIASEYDVRRVPRLLADVGVRLLVVEHLPRTRIDGAALWLDEKTPAVALSLRYDRIDYFWFTLCHELFHILHKDNGSLDNALVGEDAQPTSEKPEFEQRADREAADLLVSTRELETFIARVRPLYSKKKIIQFANRLRVHPGIVVGQLQRRGEIKYSQNREMLAKVRTLLTEAVLTDGWGHTAPLR